MLMNRPTDVCMVGSRRRRIIIPSCGKCLANLSRLARPGGFGENISASGLTDANIAVGRHFATGHGPRSGLSKTATLLVTTAAATCRTGSPRAADRSHRCYYRVLEPGSVAPANRLELVDHIARTEPCTGSGMRFVSIG